MGNLATNYLQQITSLLQAEIQRHCPYCLNLAMFLSLPGEIPAAEADHDPRVLNSSHSTLWGRRSMVAEKLWYGNVFHTLLGLFIAYQGSWISLNTSKYSNRLCLNAPEMGVSVMIWISPSCFGYCFCLFIIFIICLILFIVVIFHSQILVIFHSQILSVIMHLCSPVMSLCFCAFWDRARPSLRLSLFGHFRILGIFWMLPLYLVFLVSRTFSNLHSN